MIDFILVIFLMMKSSFVIPSDIANEDQRSSLIITTDDHKLEDQRSSLIITTDDHKLVGQTIHKRKATDVFDCALCLIGDQCKSFNFNEASGVCYLNGRRAKDKELVKEYGYIYGEKNPCEKKPCQNGGECSIRDDRQDYQCKCRTGFTGKNCGAKKCDGLMPVGMESGKISDSSITVSSYSSFLCDPIACHPRLNVLAHWSLNGSETGLTLHGSPTFVEGRLPDTKAIAFTKTNSYARIPSVSLQYRNFTIAVWIKVYSILSRPQHFVSDWYSPGYNFYFGILGNNGYLIFSRYTQNNLWPSVETSFSVTPKNWQHVAVTWNSTNLEYKLYLNGTEVYAEIFSSDKTRWRSERSTFELGDSKHSVESQFLGELMDLYIIDGTMNTEQINFIKGKAEENKGMAGSRALVSDKGRINSDAAWVAKNQKVGEYLQVDLGNTTTMTGIATQGYMLGQLQVYVTSYKVQYDTKVITPASPFAEAGKNFTGNSDANSTVKHTFNLSFVAKYVRVLPQTWHHTIALRIELYAGC